MRILRMNTNNKGFTLIETLIAISILSISVAAAFTVSSTGIKNSTLAKDQIKAFYLAQEAMEFIRNIRDQNDIFALNGATISWLGGLSGDSSDPCFFGKTCIIDSPFKVVSSCDGGFGSCPNIKIDQGTGLHGYNTFWTDTGFKREIQFNEIVANKEVMVIISLTWIDRGTHNFKIYQSIFNRR